MDDITNAIYVSCDPKITPSVTIQEVKGKYLIIVDVPSGMQRPYCIKRQEMIEGVYLRRQERPVKRPDIRFRK